MKCIICDKTLKKKAKYCSFECRYTKTFQCIHCNKTFTTITTNSKIHFCSKECRNNKGGLYGKTNCKICNKEFEKTTNSSVYCGVECRAKSQHKPKKQRTCLHCKNEFPVRHTNQKYCNVHCSSNGMKSILYEKICQICNKTFKATGYGRLYCSDKCSNKKANYLANKRKLLLQEQERIFKCIHCGNRNKKISKYREDTIHCNYTCYNNTFLELQKEYVYEFEC